MTADPRADQWQAAFKHQRSALGRQFADTGQLEEREPGQVFRGLLDTFLAIAQSGQLALCPHLNPDTPSPSYWTPCRPAVLFCGSCTGALGAALSGTPESATCDGCRTVTDELCSGLAQVNMELPLPLTVVYGLCPDCMKREGIGP